MQPDDYAARIFAEASEDVAWDWKSQMSPKGFRSGYEHLTFGEELQKLLPREFEITADIGADTLIVRRTFQEEKPRFPPLKPKQGELV